VKPDPLKVISCGWVVGEYVGGCLGEWMGESVNRWISVARASETPDIATCSRHMYIRHTYIYIYIQYIIELCQIRT